MKNGVFTEEELNKLDRKDLTEMYLAMQSIITVKDNKIEKLEAEYEKKKALVTKLEETLGMLTEQLNISNMYRFGAPNGKMESGNQVHFVFNEIEGIAISLDDYEEPKIKTVVGSYEKNKARKRKGKKAEDLKGLPITIVNHELSDEELSTEFPSGYRKLKDEIYSKLEYHPAWFEVKEHHLAVYRDKASSKIIRAPHPREMLDKSVATPSIVAGIMNAKYVNAVPLRRQEAEFKRYDLNISEQNMSSWVIRTTERYLSLLYDRMKEELLNTELIHADETPVKVSKDGRDGMKKSYMWVYRTGNRTDTKPTILYDYRKGRSSDDALNFLGNYSGKLVCDGYTVYRSLSKREDVHFEIAGCWAHALRKFRDISKAATGSNKEKIPTRVAEEAASKISEIYYADNALTSLKPEELLNRRDTEVRPLVEGFFVWIKAIQDELPPSSSTSKAISYCLNSEEFLKRFLDDAMIPLDNNPAEQAIRPFTVGRNNWKLIDTVHGAEVSAIIYSIVETAKANSIKPYHYLNHLLTEIPKHMDDSNLDFIEELLPWSESLPEEIKSKE